MTTEESGPGASPFTPDARGRRSFEEYVTAFNGGRIDRFLEYYDDAVEMVLPSATLRGKAEIRGFYDTMFDRVQETLDVHTLVADEHGLAIDVTTRFLAKRDAPDLALGPLAEGECYEGHYFILYRLRDGRIARIEAARRTPLKGPFRPDATPATEAD